MSTTHHTPEATTMNTTTRPENRVGRLVGYRHEEWVTDGLFARMNDGTTIALGFDTWTRCIDMWNELDDLRRSGRLPGVAYLMVRSVDDPHTEFATAQRGGVRVAASPKPYLDETRAAKAWAKRNGYAGRQGGWIYDPKGRAVTQGWFLFARTCARTARVFQVEGMWYEGVGR